MVEGARVSIGSEARVQTIVPPRVRPLGAGSRLEWVLMHIAYVVITVRGGREEQEGQEGRQGPVGQVWTIEECGDRDPAGARVGAMLQVLLAREPTLRRPTIRAWLPASLRPPQVTISQTQPAHDVMMVRPLTAAAAAAVDLREDELLYWRGDIF